MLRNTVEASKTPYIDPKEAKELKENLNRLGFQKQPKKGWVLKPSKGSGVYENVEIYLTWLPRIRVISRAALAMQGAKIANNHSNRHYK